MAKQKIHELAKELKIASKVIVDYMNKKTKDKEKKYTSSNALEAEEAADIRANLDTLVKADSAMKESSAQKQPETKAAQPKQNNGKDKPADAKAAAKDAEARPKKKASITAVFNAQYSKQNRRQNANRGGKSAGERSERPNRERGPRTVRPAEKPHIPIRPNADRPNYDRASAHVPDDEIVKPVPEKAEKPEAGEGAFAGLLGCFVQAYGIDRSRPDSPQCVGENGLGL